MSWRPGEVRQEPTVYTPTVWFEGEDGDRMALTVPKGWERYLHLFAAAPRMAELLAAYVEGDGITPQEAREVLAKARGES